MAEAAATDQPVVEANPSPNPRPWATVPESHINRDDGFGWRADGWSLRVPVEDGHLCLYILSENDDGDHRSPECLLGHSAHPRLYSRIRRGAPSRWCCVGVSRVLDDVARALDGRDFAEAVDTLSATAALMGLPIEL